MATNNDTKLITRGLLTRDQFAMRLDAIEAAYFTASQSARALQILQHVTAREIAMQMSLNSTIIGLMTQLMIETSISVAYTESKTNPIGVPWPPILKRDQTERNFENVVGL